MASQSPDMREFTVNSALFTLCEFVVFRYMHSPNVNFTAWIHTLHTVRFHQIRVDFRPGFTSCEFHTSEFNPNHRVWFHTDQWFPHFYRRLNDKCSSKRIFNNMKVGYSNEHSHIRQISLIHMGMANGGSSFSATSQLDRKSMCVGRFGEHES